MKLNASNLATEIGRTLTLLILREKGALTRTELLVYWADFFRKWDKIEIQSGYFYPMLTNLVDDRILQESGDGRAKTYSIASGQTANVDAYVREAKIALLNISNFIS